MSQKRHVGVAQHIIDKPEVIKGRVEARQMMAGPGRGPTTALLGAAPERCVPPRARERQEYKYPRIEEDWIADGRSKYPRSREGAWRLTECKSNKRDRGDGVDVVARIFRFGENDVEILAVLVSEEVLPIRQGGPAYGYPQHPQDACVYRGTGISVIAENDWRGTGYSHDHPSSNII